MYVSWITFKPDRHDRERRQLGCRGAMTNYLRAPPVCGGRIKPLAAMTATTACAKAHVTASISFFMMIFLVGR
jgi:hypothetical protein